MFCVWQEWNDYNLRWNDSDYGGVKDLRITPNKLWKPDVLMYNRWGWKGAIGKMGSRGNGKNWESGLDWNWCALYFCFILYCVLEFLQKRQIAIIFGVRVKIDDMVLLYKTEFLGTYPWVAWGAWGPLLCRNSIA